MPAYIKKIHSTQSFVSAYIRRPFRVTRRVFPSVWSVCLLVLLTLLVVQGPQFYLDPPPPPLRQIPSFALPGSLANVENGDPAAARAPFWGLSHLSNLSNWCSWVPRGLQLGPCGPTVPPERALGATKPQKYRCRSC